MNKNSFRKKIGVMLITQNIQNITKNLKRNNPQEHDLCWYALPTINHLLSYKKYQKIPNDVIKFSIELDSEKLDSIEPIWSSMIWKNHYIARTFLLENNFNDFYIICAGYRNKDFTKFDAQIGITGTVISNETFWQCAVRETMEECNIDISNEKSIKTIKDYNRILYIIKI